MSNLDIFQRVCKFNKDSGTNMGQEKLNKETSDNEVAMLKEELFELEQAFNNLTKSKDIFGNEVWVFTSPQDARIEIADALADIIYVAMGTMGKLGFDFNQVMDEVCRSNESKYTDGKLVKNEVGKIQKGPNFSKPDLSFVSKPLETSLKPSLFSLPITQSNNG